MFTRIVPLLLAILFAVPACSAERDLQDDTGLTSAEDGDSEPLVDETGPSGDTGSDPGGPTAPPELLLACDLPVACEFPVELVRDGSDGYAASDLCALAALAGSGGGLIQTVAVFNKAESYLDHVIVGPGQVMRQAHGRSDGLGLWQNPVERCDLRSAEFFAGCVETFDADCLDPEMWVQHCDALPSLTCPDA